MIDRLRTWNATLDQPVSARALVPLRLAIGPLVLMHLQPYLAKAAAGEIYRDRFTLPYADWYPHLPRDVYTALLWVTLGAGLMVSLGLLTRVAAWLTAGGVAYNLFLSQTHFHHNRAFLLILLIGVALLPVGDAISLDRRWSIPHRLSVGRGRRLTLAVLRLEVAGVYIASGFSKLIDPDWFGGLVTRIRVEREVGRLADASVPQWMIDVLTDPGFHSVAAKVIVLTELAIGLGLLWRRTRLAAVWLAIPFHLGIEIGSEVQVFSWAALAALVIWVTPTDRERTLTITSATGRRLFRALDWTGRLIIDVGDGTRLVERDGSVLRGRDGIWSALVRLPPTFWPVAPLYAVRTLRTKERA